MKKKISLVITLEIALGDKVAHCTLVFIRTRIYVFPLIFRTVKYITN